MRHPPKATAAEVNANPDKAGFIAHQVNIVVARPDGTELRDSLLPIRTHIGLSPSVTIVEQPMLDPFLVGPPNAKR